MNECIWTLDIDTGNEIWTTTCGKAIIFKDDNPINPFERICPYCKKHRARKYIHEVTVEFDIDEI